MIGAALAYPFVLLRRAPVTVLVSLAMYAHLTPRSAAAVAETF